MVFVFFLICFYVIVIVCIYELYYMGYFYALYFEGVEI